jgi:CRISPR-associated endonuclease Cas3-HD
MSVQLYSAPEEYYLDHISKCIEKFELLYPVFHSTIVRILEISIYKDNLREYLLQMILFHDIGKLTRRWQERFCSNNRLPSHSTPGAAYLWKTLPDSIREPLSFAVAIHHTDKGLLGDNIERPDVQAIMDGITDNDGNIIWHNEVEKLDKNYFPDDLKKLNIKDLQDMARGLRIWAKGCSLLEQHQRRLKASLAHHILKLCDISAAIDRKDYQKRGEGDYYGGWLMVEEIKNYVENIRQRGI